MNGNMKIYFGLLMLALISSQFGNSNQAESDDENYPQDKSDDYDENDFADDEKEPDIRGSTSVKPEEMYIQHDYSLKAETGEDVALKCLGEIKSTSPLFMWYNTTTLIAQGETKITHDERVIFSKKDGLLKIKNVTSYDDGTYRCRSFAGESHQTIVELKVNGPPRDIEIGHNIDLQKNIADASLVYQAGTKDLRFKCNVAKARPQAKISWIHNGNTILELQRKDSDLKVEEGGLLIIKTLHARHAGEYQCEASNELGNLKASFKIEATYPPFFTHHHKYFNTEEGNDAEIYCIYKAFPAPSSVRWMKGGSIIHESDKYQINNDVIEHHDRTKLLIKNVKNDDLTQYNCEVNNTLGPRRENVTLGVGPALEKFDGYKYLNRVVYTDWIIKSHQPLTELQILYRNSGNGWKPKSAHMSNVKKVNDNEWKVQGTIELEAGDYIIMARAKNSEGWSDDHFAQEIPISIPKDSFESQNQTGSATVVKSSLFGLLLVCVCVLHYFI